MSADTMRRILGPAHNRLLVITPMEPSKDFKRGVVAADVAEKLLTSGWTEYTGPAQAVGGWVVPGSDAALKPRSTFKR